MKVNFLREQKANDWYKKILTQTKFDAVFQLKLSFIIHRHKKKSWLYLILKPDYSNQGTRKISITESYLLLALMGKKMKKSKLVFKLIGSYQPAGFMFQPMSYFESSFSLSTILLLFLLQCPYHLDISIRNIIFINPYAICPGHISYIETFPLFFKKKTKTQQPILSPISYPEFLELVLPRWLQQLFPSSNLSF